MTARALAAAVLSLFLVGGAEAPPAPFARALLDVVSSASDDAKAAEAGTLRELRRVARLVREASRTGLSHRAALNHTVFETLGFVREVNDADLRFVELPSVLQTRRGSCVGLGALYIALGEELGWKVRGVMVPGHFYVRVTEDGPRGEETHNVELLRRGEEMPDTWYTMRFPVPGRGAHEYARALAPAEVLGVVEYDVGNERRRQGRLAEARRAYSLAARFFPDFAEAHASLGMTEQLLGELDAAIGSYRTAREKNPDLPGVDRNIELVENERGPARTEEPLPARWAPAVR